MGSGRKGLYYPRNYYRKHPKLLAMRCIYVTCYQAASSRYCASCSGKITEPNDLAIFHGLVDGPIREISCYSCGINLIKTQQAIECNHCPPFYFTIIRILRNLGYDPDNIYGLLFDIRAKEVLRIIITKDEDL